MKDLSGSLGATYGQQVDSPKLTENSSHTGDQTSIHHYAIKSECLKPYKQGAKDIRYFNFTKLFKELLKKVRFIK